MDLPATLPYPEHIRSATFPSYLEASPFLLHPPSPTAKNSTTQIILNQRRCRTSRKLFSPCHIPSHSSHWLLDKNPTQTTSPLTYPGFSPSLLHSHSLIGNDPIWSNQRRHRATRNFAHSFLLHPPSTDKQEINYLYNHICESASPWTYGPTRENFSL